MRPIKSAKARAASAGLSLLMVVGATVTVAATPAAASQTLKIITWVNPPAVQALTKIDSEFEKANPGVTVQLRTAANTSAGYNTLLSTSVDASTADIVSTIDQVQPLPLNPTRVNMTPTQYWTASNVFLPLTNQPWIHNFNSLALATETYKGQIYGVLSGVYQEMIFYNKADFAKYHFSVPTTWDQFIALLKKEQADHLVPLWLGIGSGAAIYLTRFLLEPLMYELWQPHVSGQLAGALEKGTVKWDNPAMVQALSEEATIAKYLEPGFTGSGWQAMPGDFADNKSPMLLDGTWDLTSVQQANPKIQVGAFPLPGSNVASQNEAVANPDLTLWVLRNAPDKALALKWMAFFASQQIYAQYVNITGISPSEKGGSYSSFSAKSLGKLFGVGFNPGNILPTMAANQGYWDTPTQFPLLQQAVMTGSKTPQQAAQLYASDWKTS
ncbi:MAG TPA: extracellular solute-binding protein [Acidimicrobiales bacterium]|nr:extracellular solute-binding protein [Acidimicrobiales bacterium]